MFSRVKIFSRLSLFKKLVKYESSETASKQIYSKCFFDEEVQSLLKKMTNVDFEKVFEFKGRGEELTTPRYKLLTTEELKKEMEMAQQTADYLLQIPPLVNVKDVEPEILDENSSLDGFDDKYSKIVFTDISFNVLNEERIVVVREPNGVLRTATRNEQFRMNQIYFPVPGRNQETPEMFQDEYLKEVINKEEYLFILDRACAQFEPYDAMYHKVIEQTYEAINDRSHFDRLHSTRHFGSLVFYLVTHEKIDNLLVYNINTKRIDDACDLIRLYHIVHPNCESAKIPDKKSGLEFIKDFIKSDAKKKDVLLLTLQTYKKQEEAGNLLQREVEKAQRVGS